MTVFDGLAFLIIAAICIAAGFKALLWATQPEQRDTLMDHWNDLERGE